MSRVAMITGASSGLGRGLALALAREGWSVGLLARRAGLLDEAVREVEALGGRAIRLPVDVSDRDAVHAAVRRGEEELGPTGMLVANAGITEGGRPGEVDAARVARVLAVNVLGTVYAVEAVLPGMVERGSGHVVGVSSLAGFRGLPGAPGYSASKAAMTRYLEGLRAALRGSGVAVTVLHPGFVRTPMTEGRGPFLPFLMEAEDAVAVMMRAIRRRRRSVAFPWPSAVLARILQFLPASWYDALAFRAAARKRKREKD